MNARDQKLCRDALNILHDRSGRAQEQESLLAEIQVRADCSKSEARSALNICDARGWLTGVNGQFSGKLWDINDEGEIARLKL